MPLTVASPGVRAPDATREPGGTSHFVIVDAEGNVVSITTTVESIFGSGRMTNGFFLNNQLTDFSLSPTGPDGAPVANAVAPGKRPRSAMSPVIVLDKDRRFVAALGSPGGPATTTLVAGSSIACRTRGARQRHGRPCSIPSRDSAAIAVASTRAARRRGWSEIILARGLLPDDAATGGPSPAHSGAARVRPAQRLSSPPCPTRSPS